MLRVRHQDEGDYLDVEWTPRTKNSERLTTADAWSFCHLAVARRFAPAFRVDEKNNAKEDGYRLLVATEMGEGKCSLEVGGKKETALAYIAEHLADQILLRHPSLRQTFNKEFPRKKLVDAKFELETQIDFKQGCVHVIKALVEGSGDSASLGFGPWLPTEGELIGDGIGIQLRKVLDNMSRRASVSVRHRTMLTDAQTSATSKETWRWRLRRSSE